jgi:hypothetical protein
MPWPFGQLKDGSDLVVVAQPVSLIITDVTNQLPEDINWDVMSVSTRMKVLVVLKGDGKIKKFDLHTYQLLHSSKEIIDGPNFVNFSINKNHKTYLCFLKTEKGGAFSPVSGQVDPALFSVLEIKR